MPKIFASDSGTQAGRGLGRWLFAMLLLATCWSACTDDAREGSREKPDDVSSTQASPPPAPLAPTASVAHGKELVARFECNRCHQGTGLAEPAPEKRCFGCHVDIVAKTLQAEPKLLAAWKPKVIATRFTPSLSGVGTLVRSDWVASYLLRPYALRPALGARMPRLALSEIEAASIALYLASQNGAPNAAPVPATPGASASGGDIDRGRAAFSQRGCASCHQFSGARLASQPTTRPEESADRVLAPDLAFSRERLIADNVAAWIADPQSQKADAAMPKQHLSPADVADLTAFVLRTPLDAAGKLPSFRRLPVLTRTVSYDEVAAGVLQRTCWHCHSQPDYARGDGGPGNSGGFGFPARQLDLSSYEATLSGYVDNGGTRRSVFSADANGEPALVSALLARHNEERGSFGPQRGMPLGLPPLSAEQIQLVESWVAQGHPR